ncbi:MAG: hypothetical protein ACRYG5_15545, partial [Janthinobacterium lividum]
MKEISSRDNPLFKRLRALAAAPRRQRRDGVALLDGAHLAQAWLARRGQPDLCLVTPQALQQPEIAAIAARVDGSRCLLLPDSMLAQIATVEQSVGLLFFVTVGAGTAVSATAAATAHAAATPVATATATTATATTDAADATGVQPTAALASCPSSDPRVT